MFRIAEKTRTWISEKKNFLSEKKMLHIFKIILYGEWKRHKTYKLFRIKNWKKS